MKLINDTDFRDFRIQIFREAEIINDVIHAYCTYSLGTSFVWNARIRIYQQGLSCGDKYIYSR